MKTIYEHWKIEFFNIRLDLYSFGYFEPLKKGQRLTMIIDLDKTINL